jgi:hypothetical protein
MFTLLYRNSQLGGQQDPLTHLALRALRHRGVVEKCALSWVRGLVPPHQYELHLLFYERLGHGIHWSLRHRPTRSLKLPHHNPSTVPRGLVGGVQGSQPGQRRKSWAGWYRATERRIVLNTVPGTEPLTTVRGIAEGRTTWNNQPPIRIVQLRISPYFGITVRARILGIDHRDCMGYRI